MDMQLLLIIICVAAALFFIGRRFYRCLRKGQCSCGCENDGKKNGCQGGCPDPYPGVPPPLPQDSKASRLYRREAFGIRAFCY